jgi:hypothetical protein
MVSSKNRNYHRNYGCNLVEITFKAIGIGSTAHPAQDTRFTHAGFSRIVAACSLLHDQSAARFLVKIVGEAQTEQ